MKEVSTLDKQTYNLVYAGAIQSGFDQMQVKANFITQLKIPQNKVDRLFSGKLMTLKKSLNKQKAELWQQKLLVMGAEAVMIPCIDPHMAAEKSSIEYNRFNNADANNSGANNNKSSLPLSAVEVKSNQVNQPMSPSEYDADMNARILKAQAMIATQQLAQQVGKSKESNPMKRLLVFSGGLCILAFMMYFYADSMT